MIKINNEEHFLFLANQHYDDIVSDPEEFKEDLKTFFYIRRVLNKFKKTGELKGNLLLNHIIIILNSFGNVSVDLLFYKLPEFKNEILACLVFLERIPLSDTRRELASHKILELLHNENDFTTRK